jgi:hypothetical protein
MMFADQVERGSWRQQDRLLQRELRNRLIKEIHDRGKVRQEGPRRLRSAGGDHRKPFLLAATRCILALRR